MGMNRLWMLESPLQKIFLCAARRFLSPDST